jgi:hypothetical protein
MLQPRNCRHFDNRRGIVSEPETFLPIYKFKRDRYVKVSRIYSLDFCKNYCASCCYSFIILKLQNSGKAIRMQVRATVNILINFE